MAFWNSRAKGPTAINSPMKNIPVESSEYSIWKLIGELRNLSTSNNYRYAEYDVMAEDTIIGAALQIYADNAIQMDTYSGKVLEVSSTNSALAKDIESFLRRFKIESKLWETAYHTAKYGDKYWKVLLTKDGKDIDTVESVDDPSNVADLYLNGEPAYYAYNPDDRDLSKTSDYRLFNRLSFVHFMVQSGRLSDVIEIPSTTEIDQITGRPLVNKYRLKNGESMLEGVRAIYRIIKALEDSVISASIARAAYDKIINIECGSDANEIDARKTVNRVKRLFDSHMAIDVREGQQSATTYTQLRPFMDPVFNGTVGGKGAISIESSGGEIDVSQLAHLEYFNKLKFSGLHITPSMLAYEENIPGGLNDGSNSMAQQDIRLAMYVKKLIYGMIQGITDLVNIWLTIRGRRNEVGQFQIRMAVPSLAESMAELNELQSKLESIDKLSEILTKNAPGINSAKVTKLLLEEYIPNRNLLQKLERLIDESVELAEKESEITKAEMDSALRQFESDEIPVGDMLDKSDDEYGTLKSIEDIDTTQELDQDNKVEIKTKTPELNSTSGRTSTDAITRKYIYNKMKGVD